jgi:D-alanine-D-alanine ligase
MSTRAQEIAQLTSRKDKLAVAISDIRADHFPMLLPHRVTAELLLSYLEPRQASLAEEKMRLILRGNRAKARIELVSERPPMKPRQTNVRLARVLRSVADEWEIPFKTETSLWPSVGGLVSGRTAVVCGIGPAARDLSTPQESVSRAGLIQRVLLLAQYLAKQAKG